MLLIMTNTAKNTKKTEKTCLSSLDPHGINVWSFMLYFISFCPQDVMCQNQVKQKSVLIEQLQVTFSGEVLEIFCSVL